VVVTELYLLRHAHAGDPMGWDGPDDARPLSDKGEKQADRLGRFLAQIGFKPDAILTSPKVRAARTAEMVGAHLDMKTGTDERLGGQLGLEELEQVIRDAGDPERLVVVGHDPDFSDLAALLCGTPEIPIRKGALARIDVHRPLEPGGGTLRWLVPPDLLKAEGRDH
jgi:phosphohistidine phosphatase